MKRSAYFVPIIFLLSLLFLWQCTQRSTFASLDPSNTYTGNESCQPCHKKIYASYLNTGMGHSLYLPDPSQKIERFDSSSVVYDRFSDYSYFPYWADGQFFIKEFRIKGADTVYQRVEKIDYIVGSGHQTRSYLLNRNGYLYEAPITWYVTRQLWDLSPGYADGNNSRFSREIGEECLACHTGAFEAVEGSKNRYREVSLGIDCERCHGPGAAHIDAINNDQLIDVGELTDYTIVNPAKLPLKEQFDVCQQCHLQGVNVYQDNQGPRDFRPAKALKDVYHVFLEQQADPEAFGIASHAERLQASQCFLQSEGRLTCTTCHDPHKSIAVTDTLVYVKQCQSCHRPERSLECGEGEEARMLAGGNCVSCHMPSGGTRDIPHVSFHDHKIRVVKQRGETEVAAEVDFVNKLFCATGDSASADDWGKAWLQYYEQHDRSEEYLLLAKAKLGKNSHYAQARLNLYQNNYPKALESVNTALTTDPQNTYLLFLKGEILEAQGAFSPAYDAFFVAYQLNDELIEAGLKASNCLLRARQGDATVLPEAATLLEALLDKKPFDVRILSNLGFVRMNQRELAQAEVLLSMALRYDPDHISSLENMCFLQIVKGNLVLARRYFARLVEVAPEHPSKAVLESRL